jgi:hypothetical protein
MYAVLELVPNFNTLFSKTFLSERLELRGKLSKFLDCGILVESEGF